MKPNLLVILIDDLRYDEFGAGGHPYMKTPHIDRLASEGAIFERAFHTTPICSPNRASIVSGQYASRHGIIDNVARDAMSHRLPNYHLELQRLGYETAHIGKWHMGNDGMPRPGYDTWVSYDGHGRLNDPRLNHDGKYVAAPRLHHRHHERARGRLSGAQAEEAVLALLRAQGRASRRGAGRRRHAAHLRARRLLSSPTRHQDLYRDAIFPKKPNMLAPAEVVKQQAGVGRSLRAEVGRRAQAILAALHSGRAGGNPAARADDGVRSTKASARSSTCSSVSGELDDTFIVFLGDNGFFFGEHGLGPERRFAYEEGIRSPFVVRYPRK